MPLWSKLLSLCKIQILATRCVQVWKSNITCNCIKGIEQRQQECMMDATQANSTEVCDAAWCICQKFASYKVCLTGQSSSWLQKSCVKWFLGILHVSIVPVVSESAHYCQNQMHEFPFHLPMHCLQLQHATWLLVNSECVSNGMWWSYPESLSRISFLPYNNAIG